MTSTTRHTDLLVLQDHDGISNNEDVTPNKKALLLRGVPSPTCVSMLTAKRTTVADTFKSPRRMAKTTFANTTDEDSRKTRSANKKQRLESNQFSWLMRPTHQEINKVIFNNAEVPQQDQEGPAVCNKTTMSLGLPQDLNLPSFLFMSSSENENDNDLQELKSSTRSKRIRRRRLAPTVRQVKEDTDFRHKTAKAIQQCLFDPDELCQVSSFNSNRSKMSSHKREVSSLSYETQTSLLMVPLVD